MRGLDPRIHLKKSLLKKMDCRVEPGNDAPRFLQHSKNMLLTKNPAVRAGFSF